MAPWQRKGIIWTASFAALLAVIQLTWTITERHRVAESLVKNPPWLMWGNTQQIKVFSTGSAGGSVTAGGQLVRICYARPETWRFLFAAKITQVDPLATDGSAIVSFDLTTGIGRSTLTIPNFEQYQFNWAATPPGPPLNLIWSVSVNAPLRFSNATPPGPQNEVDHIVAQDIQLVARVEWFTTQGSDAVPLPITMQVDAYFAPNVHIRPEWFKGKMANVEDEGR